MTQSNLWQRIATRSMKIRRYADNMIFIISREIRQLREGLLRNIFHFAFLNIIVFRTQLWRSCHIIVTSSVGSGTFRQADNFHNATEMGKRVSSKPSLRVVLWITGIPEFNFHEDYPSLGIGAADRSPH